MLIWTARYVLQKGSKILKDANHLIHLAKQMGLIEGQVEAALPNATKCTSWQDIQASHVAAEHASLTIKAFYGCLILLVLGLGVSFIGFSAEKLINLLLKPSKKTQLKVYLE